MLVVELNGALQSGIANNVAVGQVLGENASAGLLLLGQLVRVALMGRDGSSASNSAGRGRLVVLVGAGDSNVVGAELGVVQKQGSLGSSILLERDGGRLGLALGGNLDIRNLATAFVS